MEAKQTEKFVPSSSLPSRAPNGINVLGGPIVKRSMILEDLDFVGANPRLILFQCARYGICFLLTGEPLHLAWGQFSGPKCKRVMVAGGFINLSDSQSTLCCVVF